jgi:transcriptional regulator with XRE-family HTH domain
MSFANRYFHVKVRYHSRWQYVYDLIIDNGHTLKSFSDVAGINHKHLSRVLRGENIPKRDYLDCICGALQRITRERTPSQTHYNNIAHGDWPRGTNKKDKK